ncbi:MAG: discoidin domain-containing protein [Chloroflexi bacterium]|nr:discoidin domain-containing protein [Chloroflexota bacterium]
MKLRYLLRYLLLMTIGGLLVGACAGETTLVQPITGVLVSGPEFANIGATSVTVLVETNEDLACSVVYGTTQDYGSIATDLDMAGGGHQDHSPLLTGLEPDTLYYARFQGAGADGTLYRSEEYTFRTAPLDSTERGDQLTASLVAVSSNFGGGEDDSSFGALNALDGDPGSEWSSDGDGDAAWIEVGFSDRAHVTTIGFWTRTMGSSAQIESFQVVTDEGQTYGPFELSDAGGAHYFDTDFTARNLRFEVVSSSGGNTGAVEIELYGELEN